MHANASASLKARARRSPLVDGITTSDGNTAHAAHANPSHVECFCSLSLITRVAAVAQKHGALIVVRRRRRRDGNGDGGGGGGGEQNCGSPAVVPPPPPLPPDRGAIKLAYSAASQRNGCCVLVAAADREHAAARRHVFGSSQLLFRASLADFLRSTRANFSAISRAGRLCAKRADRQNAASTCCEYVAHSAQRRRGMKAARARAIVERRLRVCSFAAAAARHGSTWKNYVSFIMQFYFMHLKMCIVF